MAAGFLSAFRFVFLRMAVKSGDGAMDVACASVALDPLFHPPAAGIERGRGIVLRIDVYFVYGVRHPYKESNSPAPSCAIIVGKENWWGKDEAIAMLERLRG